eukprot:jgi/Bigna1/76062/fgenesh1_pg.38_\
MAPLVGNFILVVVVVADALPIIARTRVAHIVHERKSGTPCIIGRGSFSSCSLAVELGNTKEETQEMKRHKKRRRMSEKDGPRSPKSEHPRMHVKQVCEETESDTESSDDVKRDIVNLVSDEEQDKDDENNPDRRKYQQQEGDEKGMFLSQLEEFHEESNERIRRLKNKRHMKKPWDWFKLHKIVEKARNSNNRRTTSKTHGIWGRELSDADWTEITKKFRRGYPKSNLKRGTTRTAYNMYLLPFVQKLKTIEAEEKFEDEYSEEEESLTQEDVTQKPLPEILNHLQTELKLIVSIGASKALAHGPLQQKLTSDIRSVSIDFTELLKGFKQHQNEVVLLGESRIGKSFALDQALRTSEYSKEWYQKANRPDNKPIDDVLPGELMMLEEAMLHHNTNRRKGTNNNRKRKRNRMKRNNAKNVQDDAHALVDKHFEQARSVAQKRFNENNILKETRVLAAEREEVQRMLRFYSGDNNMKPQIPFLVKHSDASGSVTSLKTVFSFSSLYHAVLIVSNKTEVETLLTQYDWKGQLEKWRAGLLEKEQDERRLYMVKLLSMVTGVEEDDIYDDEDTYLPSSYSPSSSSSSSSSSQSGGVKFDPKVEAELGNVYVVLGKGGDIVSDRVHVRDRIFEILRQPVVNSLAKSLHIYAPCAVLESTRIVDPPGCNETDPFKNEQLIASLQNATNVVLCLGHKNLSNSKSVLEVFRNHVLQSWLHGDTHLSILGCREKSDLKTPKHIRESKEDNHNNNLLPQLATAMQSDKVAEKSMIKDAKAKIVDDLRRCSLSKQQREQMFDDHFMFALCRPYLASTLRTAITENNPLTLFGTTPERRRNNASNNNNNNNNNNNDNRLEEFLVARIRSNGRDLMKMLGGFSQAAYLKNQFGGMIRKLKSLLRAGLDHNTETDASIEIDLPTEVNNTVKDCLQGKLNVEAVYRAIASHPSMVASREAHEQFFYTDDVLQIVRAAWQRFGEKKRKGVRDRLVKCFNDYGQRIFYSTNVYGKELQVALGPLLQIADDKFVSSLGVTIERFRTKQGDDLKQLLIDVVRDRVEESLKNLFSRHTTTRQHRSSSSSYHKKGGGGGGGGGLQKTREKGFSETLTKLFRDYCCEPIRGKRGGIKGGLRGGRRGGGGGTGSLLADIDGRTEKLCVSKLSLAREIKIVMKNDIVLSLQQHMQRFIGKLREISAERRSDEIKRRGDEFKIRGEFLEQISKKFDGFPDLLVQRLHTRWRKTKLPKILQAPSGPYSQHLRGFCRLIDNNRSVSRAFIQKIRQRILKIEPVIHHVIKSLSVSMDNKADFDKKIGGVQHGVLADNHNDNDQKKKKKNLLGKYGKICVGKQ